MGNSPLCFVADMTQNLIEQNSDDSSSLTLANRLQSFFSSRCLAGLRQVMVSVDEDQRTVILKGVVRSLYERRLADDLSRGRACGYRVVNLVDVSELQEYCPAP
jgi:hypothetical protein